MPALAVDMCVGLRVRESRLHDHQGSGLCDCSDGAILYANGRTGEEQVHAGTHLRVKQDIGNQELLCGRGTSKRPARPPVALPCIGDL